MDLLLTSLFIFLVAFLVRFLAASRVDMTWDEGTYPFCGVTALQNIARFDFSSEAWGFEFHPPVVMYLYGITYAVYTLLKTISRHGFTLDFNLVYQEGLRLFSGRRTLLVIRLPSVILGSLSCVLTYLLCLDLFKNAAIGITAAILLALTPAFIAWSSIVMLESGVTFFYLLTLWTLLKAVEFNSVVYIIISGIFLGMALGSKETGFMVPLVVLPWSTFSLVRTYVLDGLNAAIGKLQLFLLWLLIGFAILYIAWPFLWKNPIRQFVRSLRSSRSTLISWQRASWTFYIIDTLATTPIPLLFLYGVGILEGLFIIAGQPRFILILSWALLPVVLMSMPFAPKRGGMYEVLFILPPLSILTGLATSKLSQIAANGLEEVFGYTAASNFYLYPVIFVLLSLFFIGLTAYSCASIHPYYLDYHNFISRSMDKTESHRVGFWGEGMSEAVAYVDQNAPSNTTVWVFGPKSTAFYHSSRVDLEKSTVGEPLFYHRTKAGYDVPIDSSIYSLRKGDLKFYFPYYYSYPRNVEQLKTGDVSYILVYRWATSKQAIASWIAPENKRIISMLRDHCKPVFTVKIKNTEVSWVYKVGEKNVTRLSL